MTPLISEELLKLLEANEIEQQKKTEEIIKAQSLMKSKALNDYLAKRFNQSEIDAILQDAELEYQQTKEYSMFEKKKSYLEQLQDYLKPRGLICKPYFTDGYWHMGIKDKDHIWTMSGSDTLEDAARIALVALGKYTAWDKKQSSTPHEDALKAYCLEHNYNYSFCDFNENNWHGNICVDWATILQGERIGGTHIQQWRQDCLIDSKEVACENLLKDLKQKDKDKTKKDLEEFCKENGLIIEPALDSNIRVSNDLGYIIGNDYEVMLKELKLSKFHKNRGSMFEDRDDIARRRLKKFCDEEGLRLSTTLAYRVEVSPGDGRASLYFENYKEALSSLIHAKTYGDWIWKDKDKAELEKFCEEEELTLSRSGTNNSLWRVTALSGDWTESHGSLALISQLKILKKLGHWIWSSGPYERKVRELCERKGWSVSQGKCITAIQELVGMGINSAQGGEPGFKEVWENIQKLKELLK